MELGAVVMVPAEAQPVCLAASENSQRLCFSRMPILGNDVLLSWTDRVRKLGVKSLWLTPGPDPSRPGAKSATYSALAGFARQGVERLLLIKLKSYAEMDLADLLRFHCEKQSLVTEARDERGQLGVSLLDHRALDADCEEAEFPCPPINSAGTPYQFRGYAKRITSARERQELVGDGLTGACAMRPLGTKIRQQVWVSANANVAASARIIGPTYVGARATIRAGATIGPYASVEHDCVVDCGTTVERSTVLPHTYLAPGLLIRNALVDGRYLEDLSSGVVMDLQPASLGSSILRRESSRQTFGEPATSLFAGAEKAWSFAASQSWLRVQL